MSSLLVFRTVKVTRTTGPYTTHLMEDAREAMESNYLYKQIPQAEIFDMASLLT